MDKKNLTLQLISGSGRPFHNLRPLVLASASPRRLDFLRSTGLDFYLIPSPAAEPGPEPGESAPDLAQRSARVKAASVADICTANPELATAVILAADTVVEAPDGRLLGKPCDRAQALAMLSSLFGVKSMTHRVITGCHIAPATPSPAKNLPTDFFVASQVIGFGWDQTILEAYASCQEVMDKAGAYAVQGQGGFLIKEIRGSFSNVIGLPMAETMAALLTVGAVAATT